MKATITVEMDNAAFGEDDAERAAEMRLILRRFLSALEDGARGKNPLRDSNGNTVGTFKVED